jgi:tRNA(Ile)-lysidine synthase
MNGLIVVHLQTILHHPAAGTILWKALQPYGFTGDTIQQILHTADSPGKTFSSAHYTATIDRDRILLEKTTTEHFAEVEIDESDTDVEIPGGHLFLQHLSGDLQPFLTGNNEAFLDASNLQFPLRLRKWKEGDQFKPLGMTGFKKLSDFFIDKKVPVPVKHHTYVLESNNDIVWVIGHRIDHRYRITESTVKIVHLRYEQRIY